MQRHNSNIRDVQGVSSNREGTASSSNDSLQQQQQQQQPAAAFSRSTIIPRVYRNSSSRVSFAEVSSSPRHLPPPPPLPTTTSSRSPTTTSYRLPTTSSSRSSRIQMENPHLSRQNSYSEVYRSHEAQIPQASIAAVDTASTSSPPSSPNDALSSLATTVSRRNSAPSPSTPAHGVERSLEDARARLREICMAASARAREGSPPQNELNSTR